MLVDVIYDVGFLEYAIENFSEMMGLLQWEITGKKSYGS